MSLMQVSTSSSSYNVLTALSIDHVTAVLLNSIKHTLVHVIHLLNVFHSRCKKLNERFSKMF